MREAKESGYITVYSSKPIKQGNFVTPSHMNAEDYAGGPGEKVYSKEVRISDIAWIDDSEGQIAKTKDGKSQNIRFRFIGEKEADKKSLIGVHNISEEKLRKAMKMGGFANPSMAVIDTNKGMHEGYGEISLIPKSSLIDSKTGRNAGTYTADAYMPTYPEVEKRMSEKGSKAYYDAVNKAFSEADEAELRSRNGMAVDAWLEGREPSDMAYWYMKERGLNPKRVLHDSGYTEEEKQAFETLTDHDRKRFGDLDDTGRQALLDMVAKDAGMSREELLEKYQQRKAHNMDVINDSTANSRVRKMAKRQNEDIDYYGVPNNVISNFRHKMSQAIKHDGKIDVRSTMLAAANEVREHHAKDFAKWLDEKEQQYGIEEWIFDGFDDYSGDRKYLRNTVENASKVMNREGERNSYDSIGFGATRAMLTKRMRTLDDIRKNKDLLSGKSEDISQRTKALSDELFSIIEEISAKKKIGDNQFTNNEFAEMRLQEALGKKDPVKWLEKEYDYKIEPELRKRIENFVEDVKKLPSKYFETKFNRPVKLDEFAVAVVPESTSEDIIRGLQDSGIDVRKYDGTPEGREQVALDAVRGRDDIRFRTEHEKTEQDEIERGKRGPLNQKEAEDLLSKMEANAEEAPDLELTQENWAEEFGEDGKVETPIGKVKIGENQFAKLLKKGREAQFGMIKPTLESPDVIIEEESNGNERNSSYLFIKTFNRNGDKIKYFASVTVEKDGLEVSISSHYVRKNKVLSSMMGGNILYKKESLTPNSSDRRLAEHRNDVPDLLPTQGDNDSLSSVAKIINDFKNPVMDSENLSKEASLHEEDMHHAKEAVDSLASKLNISGRVEVLTSTDGLEGRKAKAKGWYDVNTGKIMVVLPNHGSVDDVMETLLHEGVAHHGLRKMFGDGFDAFLDYVYKNADEDVKAKIKHEALNIIAGRKQRKLYKEQRGGKE